MKTQFVYFLFLLVCLCQFQVFSQDYSYDANGNLSADHNKQIASIHYNSLNLVDTILYEDGRKIIYMYTASGQKLRQQVIEANGVIKKKRDYSEGFIFEQDTLREIAHEEGRLVPTDPGNTNASFEYQYALDDHLNNTRAMLTSRTETVRSTGSFESSKIGEEQNSFLHYDQARRVNAALFDHTKEGASTHYAQRLNGSANERYGLARSLSVMPGDTVNMEVYAKYVDADVTHWTSALTSLLSQIATGASAGMVIDGAAYANASNTPFPFAGLNGTSESEGNGPRAYLNWLMFDRNMLFRKGGYVQMTDAAKENGTGVPHEKLASQLVISEPGYVYIYLSNEESKPVDVYFDDFSVEQIQGPVIQQTDYDPFGYTFNDYSRENSAPNKFLYNNKELQDDFDLNWHDYGARMYDAPLGRWHVVDALSEKYRVWSPYSYALNNPVNNTDPDGNEVLAGNEAKGVSVDPEKQKHLARVVQTLVETEEGNSIHQRADKNDNVVVVVAFADGKNFKSQSNVKTVGQTATVDSNTINTTTDPKTGRVIVQEPPSSPYYVFNGLDVTEYEGKKLQLVLIADNLPNISQEAAVLGHELQAHVNIDTWSGFLDHVLFGDIGRDLYKVGAVVDWWDGKILPQSPAYNLSDNFSATRLANQLSKQAAKKLEQRVDKETLRKTRAEYRDRITKENGVDYWDGER